MVKLFRNLKFDDLWLKTAYQSLPQNLKDYANKKVDKFDHDVTIFEYTYIAKKLGVDLSLIKFGSRGKPYFENAKQFSLSHSGNMLAVAISKKPIGVDVQTILPFSVDLAKTICNEKEFETVSKSRNPARVLTKLWAKKESLIKCKGEGFNQDLKTIFNRNQNFRYKTKSGKNFELCVCKPIS